MFKLLDKSYITVIISILTIAISIVAVIIGINKKSTNKIDTSSQCVKIGNSLTKCEYSEFTCIKYHAGAGRGLSCFRKKDNN